MSLPRSSRVNDFTEIQPIPSIHILQNYVPLIDLPKVYHFIYRDPGGFTIHHCHRWPGIIG